MVPKGTWSSTWRSVGAGMREVVVPGIGWVPGDGKSIQFWRDRWLIDEPLLMRVTTSVPHDEIDRHVESYWSEDLGWDTIWLSQYLPVNIIQRLLAVVVKGVPGMCDKLSWQGNPNGEFSVSRRRKKVFAICREGFDKGRSSPPTGEDDLTRLWAFRHLSRAMTNLVLVMHLPSRHTRLRGRRPWGFSSSAGPSNNPYGNDDVTSVESIPTMEMEGSDSSVETDPSQDLDEFEDDDVETGAESDEVVPLVALGGSFGNVPITDFVVVSNDSDSNFSEESEEQMATGVHANPYYYPPTPDSMMTLDSFNSMSLGTDFGVSDEPSEGNASRDSDCVVFMPTEYGIPRQALAYNMVAPDVEFATPPIPPTPNFVEISSDSELSDADELGDGVPFSNNVKSEPTRMSISPRRFASRTWYDGHDGASGEMFHMSSEEEEVDEEVDEQVQDPMFERETLPDTPPPVEEPGVLFPPNESLHEPVTLGSSSMATIVATLNPDRKSSIFGTALGNFFSFRNSSTNLLTETSANSGSSSSSSLRRLRGGQAALHRNVLRELSHELSSFWMNALSLEATVFIGKEGWRMADTWRSSGDTWRSAPNPLSSNRLLRLAESFHPRHIARDKWRNVHSLVKSSPPVGGELPPSSHRTLARDFTIVRPGHSYVKVRVITTMIENMIAAGTLGIEQIRPPEGMPVWNERMRRSANGTIVTELEREDGRRSEPYSVTSFCFTCGQDGHYPRACPYVRHYHPYARPYVICYECGGEGHYATVCPRKRPENPGPSSPSPKRVRRHLSESGICQVCNGGEESIIHVLRDCPAMVGIWRRLVPRRRQQVFFAKSLLEWLFENLGAGCDTSSEEWPTLFSMAVWWGWKWRCSDVFGERRTCRDKVRFVKDMADEVRRAHVVVRCGAQMNERVERLVCWRKPSVGWVKLTTDGASRGNPGLATWGGGGVIRDEEGLWLGGFALNIGICTAPLAELWGAYCGLVIAWEKGFRRVELELDSELVVGFLQAGISEVHPLAFLVPLCQDFLSRDWVVRVTHVYREANRLADGLANYAFSLQFGFHSFDYCPDMVYLTMLEDANGTGFPRNVRL
ncbi:Zinc finger CCHC-type superfamily [Arabidopsis suecica]|uniref:Zinc finger CCHC-type superfamily n=1 Tax=Arabidopsis suecica TaxID=45249 RepID=A0A8T1XX43_ARASU|nr:Zinc finger CCHC-type superfamily [Arabidopsis suecica]